MDRHLLPGATVRFSRPLLDQLNRAKDELGTTRNAIVIEAVEFWLNSQAKTPTSN
ncbi:hypothetical protein [Leptolyngbya sp. FACHB-17]|uniref:hypothetical protein n=1 Tax=unclassified Leptolyngbya TaxID=2650499 RepID=UPI001680B287|nr:hypothetical protein [Leptolyngbya sp. FACHB-17]MBD2079597.1 hypothetical protein [Leptolyngbya sp. FACHB-17]